MKGSIVNHNDNPEYLCNDAESSTRLKTADMHASTVCAAGGHRATARSTGKEERRQAKTAAVYYSECYLRGIEPMVADNAAADAKEAYNKWWVKALHNSDSDDADASAESDPSPSAVRNTEYRDGNRHDPSHPKRQRLDQQSMTVHSNPQGGGSFDCFQPNGSISRVARIPANPVLRIEPDHHMRLLQETKHELIVYLKETGGVTDSPEFLGLFDRLMDLKHRCAGRMSSATSVEGNWLTLSKPTYEYCKGTNDKGEAMYTLGRIAFDMFRPNHIMCSIKAVFNRVEEMDPRNPGRPLNVPRSLHKEIKQGNVQLRSYDILVAFTIQPNQTKRGENGDDAPEGEYVVPRPIDGVLTNQGYALPDPNDSERMSIWFSGGTLEVLNDEEDLDEWKKIFDTDNAPNRNFKEYATVLAARILLGAHLPDAMDANGTLSFLLKRPIGGHGSAFCDVMYLDDDFRIMKGHRGSIFVSTRIPDSIH